MFTLTDIDCSCIGVQEYVDFSLSDRTATIHNRRSYLSENHIIRRSRVRGLRTYERMYATIAEQVTDGRPSDTAQSIRLSAAATLDLDEQVRSQLSDDYGRKH